MDIVAHRPFQVGTQTRRKATMIRPIAFPVAALFFFFLFLVSHNNLLVYFLSRSQKKKGAVCDVYIGLQ